MWGRSYRYSDSATAPWFIYFRRCQTPSTWCCVCMYTGRVVCSAVASSRQPPPSSARGEKKGRVSKSLLDGSTDEPPRLSQCLRVAHHGNWPPRGPRLNCEGSRSSLEPQRYSVYGPPACGYALPLTIPITCCPVGQPVQAKARRRNTVTINHLHQAIVHGLGPVPSPDKWERLRQRKGIRRETMLQTLWIWQI